jgi:hypothetical protein
VNTLTTDRSRQRKPRAISRAVPQTWEEFALLHPIYEALTRQLELPAGPYPSGTKFGSWSDKKARERDLLWLDEVDKEVQAVDLRHFLVAPAVAREDSLRLFVQRHLGKPEKLPADRHKIDLLLVQYFVLCAPQELIAGRIEIPDVTKILQPVLGEVGETPVEASEPLDRILDAAQKCHSLRELVEKGLLEQGKFVKAEVGAMFYESGALVSICRFNFLLRRSFIQWLHADLQAIGAALNQLEKRGLKVVDCRRAGLSSKESISKLRQFHQHWKPPFQNDYSENSAFQPYEQLMCLREDLEDALVAAGVTPAPTSATDGKTSPDSARNSNLSGGTNSAAAPPASTPSQSGMPQENAHAPESALPNIGVSDIENLEEKIWEQLIATPPVRGRSMTTVTLENARILLSAWEVAAFISDSGPDSEDLRRLIVARALLSTSIDRRKRLMDFRVLHQAIAHARGEIPRFQERVDQLKRTQKTDGAVNLGISLKRLLSLVEEAEQLQKGIESKQEK